LFDLKLNNLKGFKNMTTTKTTVQNLASGFIAANTNKIKITAFIAENYTRYATMLGANPFGKDAVIPPSLAETNLVDLWNLISANPKNDADRKKAIVSFKTLMNRETKKVNKKLDNGLRAMVVKDNKLVEAQLRGSNSGEGGEGGEGGEEGSGNTSTDAPTIVKSLGNFDILATLTDLLIKVNGEEQVAVQAGIDALIKLDNLTSEATFIPMTHDEEAYAERLHP
jgi:hypothetical protein